MSAYIKDGGPAFPCEQHETNDNNWNQTFEPGMSLRDYFAAKAMKGCYENFVTGIRNGEYGYPEGWRDGLAISAYEIADAMLRAREVTHEP